MLFRSIAAEAKADAAPEAKADAPPVVKAKPQRAAAGGARRMQANLATAVREDAEWKEF